MASDGNDTDTDFNKSPSITPPSSPIGPHVDWEDIIINHANPDICQDDISTVAFSIADSADSAYEVSKK